MEQPASFRPHGLHVRVLGGATLVEREGCLVNALNTFDVPAELPTLAGPAIDSAYDLP